MSGSGGEEANNMMDIRITVSLDDKTFDKYEKYKSERKLTTHIEEMIHENEGIGEKGQKNKDTEKFNDLTETVNDLKTVMEHFKEKGLEEKSTVELLLDVVKEQGEQISKIISNKEIFMPDRNASVTQVPVNQVQPSVVTNVSSGVDDELEELKKKKQMLELKREIADMENGVGVKTESAEVVTSKPVEVEPKRNKLEGKAKNRMSSMMAE